MISLSKHERASTKNHFSKALKARGETFTKSFPTKTSPNTKGAFMSFPYKTQVAVIGAGHAGIEAALASARLGVAIIDFYSWPVMDWAKV